MTSVRCWVRKSIYCHQASQSSWSWNNPVVLRNQQVDLCVSLLKNILVIIKHQKYSLKKMFPDCKKNLLMIHIHSMWSKWPLLLLLLDILFPTVPLPPFLQVIIFSPFYIIHFSHSVCLCHLVLSLFSSLLWWLIGAGTPLTAGFLSIHLPRWTSHSHLVWLGELVWQADV